MFSHKLRRILIIGVWRQFYSMLIGPLHWHRDIKSFKCCLKYPIGQLSGFPLQPHPHQVYLPFCLTEAMVVQNKLYAN